MTKRVREVVEAWRIAEDARHRLTAVLTEKKLVLALRSKELAEKQAHVDARVKALDILCEALDDVNNTQIEVTLDDDEEADALEKLLDKIGGGMDQVANTNRYKVRICETDW